MTTDLPIEPERVGDAVVIVAGLYTNEPGVIVANDRRLVDVLLARSGERVTVRRSSLEVYR